MTKLTTAKRLLAIMAIFAIFIFVSCSSSDDKTDGDSYIADGDAAESDTLDTEQEDIATDGDEDSSDNLVDGDIAETIEEDMEHSENDAEKEVLVCSHSIVDSYSGVVLDEFDNPIEGAISIICVTAPNGHASCLNPAFSKSNGSYAVTPPDGKRCVKAAAIHLMLANSSKAGLYCKLDITSGGQLDIGTHKLYTAPDGTRDALGAGDQAHDIVAADGTTLTVIPDDLRLYDATYTDLKLLVWDSATNGWPCFIDTANPPSELVALVPEIDLKNSNAAHIAFNNTSALTAGTEVDLFALGGTGSALSDGTSVPEGEWLIIGKAVVSADGTMIETEQDAGLPFYTWVGWKEKPVK